MKQQMLIEFFLHNSILEFKLIETIIKNIEIVIYLIIYLFASSNDRTWKKPEISVSWVK